MVDRGPVAPRLVAPFGSLYEMSFNWDDSMFYILAGITCDCGHGCGMGKTPTSRRSPWREGECSH
jgi:hypothetical protein